MWEPSQRMGIDYAYVCYVQDQYFLIITIDWMNDKAEGRSKRRRRRKNTLVTPETNQSPTAQPISSVRARPDGVASASSSISALLSLRQSKPMKEGEDEKNETSSQIEVHSPALANASLPLISPRYDVSLSLGTY